jgi:hypothetical protein
MHIKKDFEISVTEDEFAAFKAKIIASLPAGWWWDTESEARNAEMRLSPSDEQLAYFRCGKHGGREGAMVAVTRKDPNTLHIANIVPDKTGILSGDEFNRILVEFRGMAAAAGYQVSEYL